jgi:Coenzyme PQQ synthesis protein D (PqqD)
MVGIRKSGLTIERIDSELLVFDPETDEVHSLNESSALVFDMCDGSSTTEEMRARLPEIGLPADPEIIELALAELDEASLIAVQPALAASNVTRRTLTRRLGLSAVAVALIPVVETILAQPAAAAGSFLTTPAGTSGTTAAP